MKKLLLVLLSTQMYTLTFAMDTPLFYITNTPGVRAVPVNDLAPLLALIKLPTPDNARDSHCATSANCQRARLFRQTTFPKQFAFKRLAKQKRVTQTTSKL